MHKILHSLPLLLAAATPAHATGGFVCEANPAKPIEVSLVFGRAAGAPLVGATLTEGGVEIPTEKAQWWIEGTELRVVLIDPNAEREEVVIKARGRGEVMVGTLKRGPGDLPCAMLGVRLVAGL